MQDDDEEIEIVFKWFYYD